MIRSITNCIAAALLCILVTNISYSFNNDGVAISKTAGGYDVQYTLPGYNSNIVTREGEQYIVLNIDSYGITPAEGLPMLPQISFNLILNTTETSPGFDITSQSTEEKYLSDKIFPAQAPWEKSKDLKDRPFTINRAYYAATGNINSPVVSISEPFIIAGVKAVRVTITPFNYDPSSGRLVITNTARFKINLASGHPFYTPVPESFSELFNALFVNSDVLRFTPTNNYLIITSPDFEAAMGAFVSYKSSMGYNVLMVNTGTTGTTNTAILNYIQNRYNNLSTRPEFILLAGDIDRVPEWTGIGSDNPHTDLNYTLLEGGDAYADAFIGRFPAANTTHLTNMISKTIYMEGNIGSLTKKSIFMASTDNWDITEATHNFVIDSFFAPQGYTNVKLYTHTYGATTQQLIDALNANQLYAIYSGHGSTTSWADGPPLSASQVNALNNSWFPFVYSFACLTGQFQQSECFGETWVRGPKGGSVFWGSSVNSFWDEDDILERRLYRAKFTDGLKKTAPMFVMGKYYLVQHYGSVTTTMRRYLEMYNCMGDPSMYQAAFGPVITHTPLQNTENLAGPYVVNCVITPSGSNIDPAKTKIFWTRGTVFTDSVQMTNSGGNNWTASIPGNGSQAVYRYYIRTCDLLNRIAVLPGDAPTGYFTFAASPDQTPPMISHTQQGDIGKPMWPVTVSAVVTDNIGVDSVWVNWYINTPSNIKHFRLANTSGNTYTALFNSVNSEVNVGDSVFYCVNACDISSNHNLSRLPTAGYFKFGISSQAYTSFCRQTYVPVRDNQTNYDTLFVPEYGTIVDFNFKMESLIHSWDGDVTYSIKSPSGQEVTLSDNRGSSGDNFINTVFDDSAATPVSGGTAPFTGSFRPESPLTVFFGQEIHGNWVLSVNDNATGDTGRVNNYCLNILFNSIIGITNSQVPVMFSLSQNYPNPFNPVTKITYSVPKQQMVTIRVYDLLGREVTTLVNEIKTSGFYDIEWNAHNFASGVYLYRMEAGSFTDVKKMVIIK